MPCCKLYHTNVQIRASLCIDATNRRYALKDGYQILSNPPCLELPAHLRFIIFFSVKALRTRFHTPTRSTRPPLLLHKVTTLLTNPAHGLFRHLPRLRFDDADVLEGGLLVR